MHLAIVYVLLGIVMLTGEIVAIPLKDLEQSGCLEFRVSSFSAPQSSPSLPSAHRPDQWQLARSSCASSWPCRLKAPAPHHTYSTCSTT